MEALLKMNVIGMGGNQVPPGSTITEAKLRLKTIVGGDGLLYRCAEPWDANPTWAELNGPTIIGASTTGPFIGVGLNSGQSKEFDVTSHVQAWADGTTNQGWVIKGDFKNDDCQAARIYNGSAGQFDRPKLTVIFIPPTPPDTSGPRIIAVDVGTTVTTHANFPVPGGSGEQIRSLPVARVNEFWVRFNEPVNIDRNDFSLMSAIDGTEHPLRDGMFGFEYPQGTNTAYFRLALSIDVPEQVVLKIKGSTSGDVTDTAGNLLDGEWTPPPCTPNDTGTKPFPSGNLSPGGDFLFFVTMLPADASRNNLVEQADLDAVLANWGEEVGWDDGEVSGNGLVEQQDLDLVLGYWGTSLQSWPCEEGASAMTADGGSVTTRRASALHALDESLARLNMHTDDTRRLLTDERIELAAEDAEEWRKIISGVAAALDAR